MIMKVPKRAMHMDFHTLPAIPDVGADFNPEEFAKILRQARVQHINFFARCNLGFSYYPTKVGFRHPGLRREMTGDMIAACHAGGIGVSAYINVGFHHELAQRRRDWAIVNRKGQVCIDEGRTSSFFRRMCFNTPYLDHVLAEISEILDLYPEVDGFFFDSFGNAPCYGYECLNAMREQGMDVLDDVQVQKFADDLRLKVARRLRAAVPEDKMLFMNGIPYKPQAEISSHLELECLPTSPEWGYDTFPLTVRYLRNLGKPVLAMTARFHQSWGDFGGLRPLEALNYDCFHALAQGVDISIGDHLHPRGKPDSDVYRMIGNAYSKVSEREPWTANAKPVTEIAILSEVPKSFGPHHVSKYPELTGAARMLCELNCQFDVIDDAMDFSKYRLLILPDTVTLSPELAEKISNYLAGGGKIFSSNISGLDQDKTGFVLKEWGTEYNGPAPTSIEYFQPESSIAADLPEMPVTIYETGISMTPGKGSEVLSHVIPPYFDIHWDGFHGHRYAPPGTENNFAVAVQSASGNVIHCNFPIFAAYSRKAPVQYRTLLKNCLERLLPDPLIKAENFPAFGRVTLNRQDNRLIMHLLVYVPEKRGETQIIEEPVTIKNPVIQVKTDAETATIVPEIHKLETIRSGNYLEIRFPELTGAQMVVIE